MHMDYENRIESNTLKGRFVQKLDVVRQIAIPHLQRFANLLEANSWAPLLLFSSLYLFAAVVMSQHKLLWFDELFTYYIAQAPDIKTLMHQTQTLDWNPPLLYLADHALFKLFHVGPTISRVPSIIGFLVCSLCVYRIVKSRMGVLWGLVGLSVIVFSPAFELSIEARPYALTMGFVSLGLLGWQLGIDGKHRKLGILCLLVGGIGGSLSHIFAMLAFGALMLTELYRSLFKRRVDWPVMLATLAPLCSIALYGPMLRSHAATPFPPAFQAHMQTLLGFYRDLIVVGFVGIFSAIVIALPLILGKHCFKQMGNWAFSKVETLAFLSLLAAPAILICYLILGHAAFFPRYGFTAFLAISFLIPAFLHSLTNGNRIAALACAALLFAAPLVQTRGPFGARIPVLKMMKSIFRSGEWGTRDNCEACSMADRVAPNLPFVDANELTFIVMDYQRDSKFLSRVYYLADAIGALKDVEHPHDTAILAMKQSFPIRANVEPYEQFVSQHSKFVVYGDYDSPYDWLLPKLLTNGAQLRLLGAFPRDSGDRELWEITLKTD